MARRRSSTGSILGLIVATGLVLAGRTIAQQPAVPPTVPTQEPLPAASQPVPPATSVIPPVPVPPGTGAPQLTPQPLPGGPGPINGPGPVPQQLVAPPQAQRFNFKINPNTPVKDLLPTPP